MHLHVPPLCLCGLVGLLIPPPLEFLGVGRLEPQRPCPDGLHPVVVQRPPVPDVGMRAPGLGDPSVLGLQLPEVLSGRALLHGQVHRKLRARVEVGVKVLAPYGGVRPPAEEVLVYLTAGSVGPEDTLD